MADGVAVVIFEKSDVFIALHRLAQRDHAELVIELVDHGDLAFGYLENLERVGVSRIRGTPSGTQTLRALSASEHPADRRGSSGYCVLPAALRGGHGPRVRQSSAIGGGPPDARKIGLTGGGKGCRDGDHGAEASECRGANHLPGAFMRVPLYRWTCNRRYYHIARRPGKCAKVHQSGGVRPSPGFAILYER